MLRTVSEKMIDGRSRALNRGDEVFGNWYSELFFLDEAARPSLQGIVRASTVTEMATSDGPRSIRGCGQAVTDSLNGRVRMMSAG